MTGPLSLKGVFTSIVTPFLPDEQVDWKSLERLLDFQVKSGIDGIITCGLTGEVPTLSSIEQEILIKKCVEKANKQIPVIVGVGTNNTKTTIENANRAKECGADALIIVTPYYNKPSQRGLFTHFAEVAARVKNIPIIIQDSPSRTGVYLAIETLTELVENYPQFVALNDGSGKPHEISEKKEQCPDRFVFLAGQDSEFIRSLEHGATGIISVASNAYPETLKEIYKLFMKDRKKAQELFAHYQDLFTGLSIEPSPVPIKYLLGKHKRISHDTVRLPLVDLTTNSQKIIDQLENRLHAH